MLFFLIISIIFSRFHPFHTIKISSKPARASISGNNFMLAVSEISDSINSFPPNLVIYSIGQTSVGKMQTITGPCYSLGTQISPCQIGFYATAPASAFRWGDPGPLLYKIVPPMHSFEKLPYPRIPYGETFAVSKRGNVQVLCSPYSSSDCLLVKKNQTIKLSTSSPIELFGQAVACSHNGSIVVTVSKSVKNENEIVHFFSSDNGKILYSYEIHHNPPLSSRSKPPIVQFLDDKYVAIAFPDIQKLIIYKFTINGWTMKQTINIALTSFAQLGQHIITVTQDGIINLIDRFTFFQREETIVPRSTPDSKFTQLAVGKDWFAVLEDSANHREVHIFSSREKPIIRGIAIFLVFFAIAFLGIMVRSNFNVNRVIKKITKRKNTKQV